MKAIEKFLLSALILFLLPFVVSAHPGHDHEGTLWQIFTHFVLTYYIYFIVGLGLITGVYGYLRAMRKREKQDIVRGDENKK